MQAVGQWLEARWGEPVVLEVQGTPGSGFSADNLIFTATRGGRISTHVLRVEPSNSPPYPEQAPGLGTGLSVQTRTMAAISDRLAVASLVGVEFDETILGAPFLVMDFVDGLVPKEVPPCTIEGFYTEAAPDFRETMTRSGLEALATLHTVPWRERGLADLAVGTPGAARQFELWDTHLATALRGRDSGLFSETRAWLLANMPPAPADEEVVLLWGDARMGNVIWDKGSGTPLCLTDFEGASVGERELDLGWWLMADRWMHEGSGVQRLAGEPTRAEQIAIYEAAAGRASGDLYWYELFSAYRFAVTVVVVTNNWADTGALPGDHLMWRDNPATELIEIIRAGDSV